MNQEVKSIVLEAVVEQAKFHRPKALKIKAASTSDIVESLHIRRTDVHESLKALVSDGRLILLMDSRKKLYIPNPFTKCTYKNQKPRKKKLFSEKELKYVHDIAQVYGDAGFALDDITYLCSNDSETAIIAELLVRGEIVKVRPNCWRYVGTNSKLKLDCVHAIEERRGGGQNGTFNRSMGLR